MLEREEDHKKKSDALFEKQKKKRWGQRINI